MTHLFGLVNKVVVRLSETPLHRLCSQQVMGLRGSGRRSGRAYAIPVSYGRDEATGKVTCMTEVAGVGWKNMLAVASIEINLRGVRMQV